MTNIKDFAIGTVLTPPSGTTGTTVVLNSGQGANMPAVPFKLSAYPPNAIPTLSNAEAVLVTARSTDTLTITRAQLDTTAQTWSAGWIVANAIFVEDMFTSSLNDPEVLSGTPNGTLTTFGLSQAYTRIWLYKNGVFMHPGGNDYTLSSNGLTVTFVTPPATDTKLIATGIVGSQVMISGSNSTLRKQPVIGTKDGSNTSFSVANAYIPGTLEVFRNGSNEGSLITETSPSTGAFTMDAALSTDDLQARYDFVNSVSGNADTVDGFNASSTPTAGQLMPLIAKTTDANGWRKYDYGLWQEYRKRHTFSQTVTTTGAFLTLSSSSLPVGMSTIGTNYLDYSVTATGSALMLHVVFEGSSASGGVAFTARSNDINRSYTGFIDITLTTA